MAKKTTISSIMLQATSIPEFAAVYFRVGSLPLKADGQLCTTPDGNPAFPPVSEIRHCRDRFGGGAQIAVPCYDVHFEGSDERLIIPATQFVQVTIVMDEDTVPGLPE